MEIRNYNYSKEFETEIVGFVSEVLEMEPESKTANNFRYIMDAEELTEDEFVCLFKVVEFLDNVGEFSTYSAKNIEDAFLSIPTDCFINTFERLGSKFEELDNKEKESLPSDFVSGYYSISQSCNLWKSFFESLDRSFNREFQKVIKDTFPEMFESSTNQKNDFEPIPQEPTEDPVFEITPIK